MRQRCYVCYRPLQRCFCDAVPDINNRTDVLIIQHVKERFHAFNTARIVRKALRRCRLVVDQTDRLAQLNLNMTEDCGILYPSSDATPLDGLPAHQRPQQLVVCDGTWNHTRTLMRDLPMLQSLRRYCLRPELPGRYRLRKAPFRTALSTLEAVVSALRLLEPETQGLDQLERAFLRMVQEQLDDPRDAPRVRKKRNVSSRPSSNIPRVLRDSPQNVVVAYGEVLTRAAGRRRDKCLVWWCAQRLISGEEFEAAVQPAFPLTAAFQQHTGLTAESFSNAATPKQFRELWNNFLRPDDWLCVFNHSTAQALEMLGATLPPVICLKSVHLSEASGTLNDLLNRAGISVSHHGDRLRGRQRLENAVAFATHLSGIRSNATPPAESRLQDGL